MKTVKKKYAEIPGAPQHNTTYPPPTILGSATHYPTHGGKAKSSRLFGRIEG